MQEMDSRYQVLLRKENANLIKRMHSSSSLDSLENNMETNADATERHEENILSEDNLVGETLGDELGEMEPMADDYEMEGDFDGIHGDIMEAEHELIDEVDNMIQHEEEMAGYNDELENEAIAELQENLNEQLNEKEEEEVEEEENNIIEYNDIKVVVVEADTQTDIIEA